MNIHQHEEMGCAVATDEVQVEIYEERKRTQSAPTGSLEVTDDVLLGRFLFASIPREGELLSLTAFGAPNFEGFSRNVYRVLGVLHEGRHLTWETLAGQRWEERNFPRTKLFVIFKHSVDGQMNTGINYSLRRDGGPSLP
jgi:hypothetical protein